MPRDTQAQAQRGRQAQRTVVQPQASTAVVPFEEKRLALRDALNEQRGLMAAGAANGFDPTKMAAVALTHFTRTPALWDCTPVSIARAVVEATQLGLDMHFGSVYLVPYRNRGVQEAQLIIGYRGLATLARRSGEIRRVWADVVRQRDQFHFQRGLHPDLVHVPYQPASGDELDPGPMTHVYACAEFTDGGVQFDVMTAAEVYAIRQRSKGAWRDGALVGPWLTDEAEMSKKTALRRLSKMLPLTTEARIALDRDDDADQAPAPAPARPTSSQALAARARAALGGGDAETTRPPAAGTETTEGQYREDGQADDQAAQSAQAVDHPADAQASRPAGDGSPEPAPDDAQADDDAHPSQASLPACGAVHDAIGLGPCVLPADGHTTHEDRNRKKWSGQTGARR